MTETDKEKAAREERETREAEQRKADQEAEQRKSQDEARKRETGGRGDTTTGESTQVLVEGRRVGPGAAGRPVKAFKLKAGHTHIQDGHYVKAGDEVMLNEQQAKAFKDKFEAVDEKAKFELTKDATYRPSSSDPKDGASKPMQSKDQKGSKDGEAPQGPAPQSPVVGPGFSGRGVSAGPVLGIPARDPNAQPADPTTLEPERQGQRSRLRGER